MTKLELIEALASSINNNYATVSLSLVRDNQSLLKVYAEDGNTYAVIEIDDSEYHAFVLANYLKNGVATGEGFTTVHHIAPTFQEAYKEIISVMMSDNGLEE